MLNLFKIPQRLFISGSSSFGKSLFTEKLIKKIYSDQFDVIVICGVKSHSLEDDEDMRGKLHVSPTIVDPADYKEREDDNVLLVLDDHYAEAADSSLLRNIYTRGRLNISIIKIVQNLFNRGKYSRDISLNATWS